MRHPAPRHAAVAALLIVAPLASACSSTATVTRSDGSSLEGTILGHDGSALVVADEATGAPTHIPDEVLADVDHPGSVALVLGSGIAALGLLPAGVGVTALAIGAGEGGGMGTAMGLIYLGMSLPLLGAGLGLAIDGGLRWTRSRDATQRPFGPGGEVEVQLAPWVAPHGEDLAGGAGVSVRF